MINQNVIEIIPNIRSTLLMTATNAVFLCIPLDSSSFHLVLEIQNFSVCSNDFL